MEKYFREPTLEGVVANQRSFPCQFGEFLVFRITGSHNDGVKDQNDKRLVIHHGGWTVKFVVWVLLIVLMFFVPDVIISLYETLSKFGSGLFLLVQVIILLDATHTWNAAWVEKDERNWYIVLLAVSVGCYIAAFTIAGLMFIWFNPSGHDCGLNVFFIVMTMILALGFAIIALHPAALESRDMVASLQLVPVAVAYPGTRCL
ncbi:hypothetical protein MKX01_003679 [Papaver californicum]|nr:hypothetical protein MKX01_003679 [Papaver californicum]